VAHQREARTEPPLVTRGRAGACEERTATSPSEAQERATALRSEASATHRVVRSRTENAVAALNRFSY